jgi:hypothetical protein
VNKQEFVCFLEDQLRLYNEVFPMMNFVLFDQAIEHILRIVRILIHPRGHALLIGIGGIGKQSLTRLASFICQYEVVELSLNKAKDAASVIFDHSSSSHDHFPLPQYTCVELKEDLKEIYRKCAGVVRSRRKVTTTTKNTSTNTSSMNHKPT